jgi:NitT/TauT family transport system permease protein
MTNPAARMRPASSYWTSRARRVAIKSALRGAVLALILATWQMLAQRSGPLGVPSVTKTLEATWTLLADGSLIRGLAVTNEAMVIGYVVSLAVSLPVGLAMGLRPGVKRLLEPYLTILIALPMIAVLPVAQVMFGLTLTSRVVVVVLFAFTYMTVNTMVGVETVDERLREMSRSFQASWWQTMRNVVLPGATPAIIAGARLGLGRAIMGMIVAELLLVSPGIGSMILDYQASFEPPYVFAILLVAVLEGVVLMQLAAVVEQRLLRWRDPVAA